MEKTTANPTNPTNPTATSTAKAIKATDELFAASEAGRKAMMACVEATAEMSAQFDRLMRAQLGYSTAAQKDAADFMSHSIDGAMKAREAFRRAGVDMAEKTFAFATAAR